MWRKSLRKLIHCLIVNLVKKLIFFKLDISLSQFVDKMIIFNIILIIIILNINLMLKIILFLWLFQELIFRQFEQACEESGACTSLSQQRSSVAKIRCIRECVSPSCYKEIYLFDQVTNTFSFKPSLKSHQAFFWYIIPLIVGY